MEEREGQRRQGRKLGDMEGEDSCRCGREVGLRHDGLGSWREAGIVEDNRESGQVE